VIDPRNQIDAVMDVAVADGKIAAVRAGINPAEARTVVDGQRLYVTPGLIDAHVHLFATTGMKGAWAGDNSVLPDEFSFRTGVTTMVDAAAPAGATSKISEIASSIAPPRAFSRC
jgi:dihydroorotase